MSRLCVLPQKSRKKRKPESALQRSFCKWMFYNHRDVYETMWPTPNGGYRLQSEAAALKEEGVKAGVPDIFIAHPNSGYAGLFIEFKIRPNRPTEKQADMMMRLIAKGYDGAFCYSLEEAINVVEIYLRRSHVQCTPVQS